MVVDYKWNTFGTQMEHKWNTFVPNEFRRYRYRYRYR